MDFGGMDFMLIWTILFQYFGYLAFCFMDFSLIWTFLAGTNMVHILGIGCIQYFHFQKSILHSHPVQCNMMEIVRMFNNCFFSSYLSHDLNDSSTSPVLTRYCRAAVAAGWLASFSLLPGFLKY